MTNVRNFFIALGIALGLLAFAPATVAADAAVADPATLTNGIPGDSAYPLCETEESDGPCVWNAARQGNGYGWSFTVHRDGSFNYWPSQTTVTTYCWVQTGPELNDGYSFGYEGPTASAPDACFPEGVRHTNA